MADKIMISHATADQDLANIISTLLKKCSLNQIDPWFSSDPSVGGIGVGQRWFDKIRTEIISSKAVIVLLTDNSVSSSWVQFEAGFGAGTAELELIPIIVGMEDATRIPNPISHWQIFNVSAPDPAVVFIRKVLDALSIHFDEELVRIAVNRALHDISGNIKNNRNSESQKESNVIDKNLKRYLDQKFFDLSSAVFSKSHLNFSSINLSMESEFSEELIRINIDIDTTVDDVLDEIYFQISKFIKPFTYLENWIVVDEKGSQAIVIREIADRVPARHVFRQDGQYKVIKLLHPYSPSDRHLGENFVSNFP